MKNNKAIATKASQNVADRLVWQTAHKDQAGIARELASGKDIPEVYGLGEAGLFDEFFFFLDNFGISKLFKGLDVIIEALDELFYPWYGSLSEPLPV